MSEDETSPNPSTLSPDFCDEDADVHFLSSDNIEFRIHSNNLNVTCGGFPPTEIKSQEGEMVPLPEDSTTLRILFRFVYPRRHPDLNGHGFEGLAKVAEAAEKYEVFSAMTACRFYMRQYVASNPLEVFVYASKHAYPTIADECIAHMLELPLTDVMNALPIEFVQSWVEYWLLWSEKVKSTFTLDTTEYRSRSSGLGTRRITTHYAKTHITDELMNRAWMILTKNHPRSHSNADIQDAFRRALVAQGHGDPEGARAKEPTYEPTAAEMFYNSVREFSRVLDANVSSIPTFDQYLVDRQGTP